MTFACLPAEIKDDREERYVLELMMDYMIFV
jgi:hypothetical protein